MTGGCLCGAVRYRITVEPTGTTLCHCEDCRKASGAPVVAWTFFPGAIQTLLTFEGREPRLLEFAGRQRTFCPCCGSPISFYDPTLPDQFEVTTCTLDDAWRMSPVDHNWVCDRLPWFDTVDDLPRHERETRTSG